jgi:hypothetical protein
MQSIRIVIEASSAPVVQQMLERRLLNRSLVRGIAGRLASLMMFVSVAYAHGGPIDLRGHDGLGREFALADLRGQVVALTFVSRYTRDESARINNQLSARAREVAVVTVVDLIGIPSFAHGYARRRIAEADAAGGRHVVDDQGALRRALGAQPDKQVDIYIIDRDGTLRGRYVGERQLPEALRLVDALRSSAQR